nr:probable beta-D-xylosidase 5 [Coffea arabica]
MARLHSVLFLSVLCYVATAKKILLSTPRMDDSQSSHVTQTYTYVCHPSRFNGLGLNMEYFGYCNKSLPFEVRAKDLVDRLSLTEKVGQLGDQANGVPRIGLPKYYWWSEALHGVSDFGDTATFFNATIPGATINQGKVREADIDKVLKNLYIVLFRLGHFDGSPQFEKLGKDDICSQSHIDLAIEAASEGVVLLKNDNNTLPLDAQKVKKVAVVGPHANATKVMIGNYAGIPCKYTSPLDAFRQAYGNDNVYYAPGCLDVACRDYSLVFPAVQASKKADAVIIVAGIDTSVEAESLDRENLLLPGYQYELIDQISRQSTTPIILVILSAGGVDISIAKNDSRVSAILWAGYPGEKGGQGIADVILGKYNAGT